MISDCLRAEHESVIAGGRRGAALHAEVLPGAKATFSRKRSATVGKVWVTRRKGNPDEQ